MTLSARLLAVRPGEGPLVTRLGLLFATVEAGRGLGEVAVTTLFVNRVGAESLPNLFVALGFVSMVVALGYGAGIATLPRRPFLVGLLGVFAAGLVLLRVAIAPGGIVLYGTLWVAVNVVNALLLTVLWTVAGSTLDVRQARRLFPLCTSAAIAGAFAGTLASGPLTALVGSENLVVLDAALLAVAAVVTGRIAMRRAPAAATRPTATSPSVRTQLGAGFAIVAQSPLLRLVAVAYVLFAVLLFSVSYPYARALERAFEGDDVGLATTVGLVLAGVTAVSFVVSFGVANRLLLRLGVATVALFLPLVYAAGFLVWLLEFSLVTAIAFSFSQQVVQRGLSNATWSAFFTIVPGERRPAVLAFIDGVPGQFGTVVSGALLLIAASLFQGALAPVFAMGLVAAVVCVAVVLAIRRRYGATLLTSLRAGLAEQVLEGGPGLAAIGREPGLLAELRAGVTDERPASRRLAIDLLGRLEDHASADALAGRLDDLDRDVRAGAVRALGRIAPDRLLGAADRLAADPAGPVRAALAEALARAGDPARSGTLVDGLLTADRPEDRIAGIEAAASIGDPAAGSVIRVALGDDTPAVRAAAIASLGRLAGTPDDLLLAGLDDPAGAVRRAAVTALDGRSRSRETTEALLRLLSDGNEREQEGAVVALAGADPEEVREPVRRWALGRVERAAHLRSQSAALRREFRDGGAHAPDTGRSAAGSNGPEPDRIEGFLADVLERRARRIEDQLLAAVATLGAPEATGLIRRSLRDRDPEVRAQAIEAIDALGDRELGRGLVELLEETPERLPSGRGDLRIGHRAAVLGDLVDDPDPWVRALALAATARHLEIEQREVARRSEADADPAVRATLASLLNRGVAPMTDTGQTLGPIERMLFLRGVPLFARLDPEDLQRIAGSAIERLYPAGERLVREGDLGDELIVIVEGSVRVVRENEDGRGERLIRTYGAGDHIGELAVLRERPRAASVIAEEDVRGLVIAGDALRAILHERPEAALAMLGTLAERISAQ